MSRWRPFSAFVVCLLVAFALGWAAARIASNPQWQGRDGSSTEPEPMSLSVVGEGIGRDAERLSAERFAERIRRLDEHYADDPYAIAVLAYAKSQAEKNFLKDRRKAADSLDRSLAHIHTAKQRLLLLEMQAKLERGLAAGALGDLELQQSSLKDVLTLFEQVRPPLYADATADAEWHERTKRTYVDAARWLVSTSSVEDLAGTPLSTCAYAPLAEAFPHKIEHVLPLDARSAGQNRDAIAWMRLLDFSDPEKAETIRRAVETLQDWADSSARRRLQVPARHVPVAPPDRIEIDSNSRQSRLPSSPER